MPVFPTAVADLEDDENSDSTLEEDSVLFQEDQSPFDDLKAPTVKEKIEKVHSQVVLEEPEIDNDSDAPPRVSSWKFSVWSLSLIIISSFVLAWGINQAASGNFDKLQQDLLTSFENPSLAVEKLQETVKWQFMEMQTQYDNFDHQKVQQYVVDFSEDCIKSLGKAADFGKDVMNLGYDYVSNLDWEESAKKVEMHAGDGYEYYLANILPLLKEWTAYSKLMLSDLIVRSTRMYSLLKAKVSPFLENVFSKWMEYVKVNTEVISERIEKGIKLADSKLTELFIAIRESERFKELASTLHTLLEQFGDELLDRYNISGLLLAGGVTIGVVGIFLMVI